MKSLKTIIILVILLNSFIAKSQTSQAFSIDGNIQGLKDGDTIRLLSRDKNWHHAEILDSSAVVNGKFHLKYLIQPSEGVRTFEVWRFASARDPRETWINIRGANNEKMVIKGTLDDIDPNRNPHFKVSITGSPSYNAKLWEDSILNTVESQMGQINKQFQKIKDNLGYDGKLVEQQVFAKEKVANWLDVTLRQANSLIKIESIPLVIADLGEYHFSCFETAFNRLTPQIKNSLWGNKIKSLNIPELAVEQPFPQFTLPDRDGRNIKLSDIISKNKFTLVHFWGPGSVMVAPLQKELKFFYQKFHSKGLEIVAVSADTSKTNWQDEVDNKSKYPWINVLAQPRGWEKGSLINDRYSEGGHSVPNTTNILLDEKGKIIAWDVYGPELQYYLEKYLGDSPPKSN